MRNILHFIFLLLFTLHVQSAPVLWVLYYANADTIAAAYCVNPSDPECHGRCHVAKVTEEQSRNESHSEQESERPMPFMMASAAEQSYTDSHPQTYIPSMEHIMRGFSNTIDHPPSVFS